MEVNLIVFKNFLLFVVGLVKFREELLKRKMLFMVDDLVWDVNILLSVLCLDRLLNLFNLSFEGRV